jgi:RNA-directed DNA polymerase
MGAERQQSSGKQLDLFDEALKASLCHDVTGKGGTGAGTIEERQTPAAWAEKLALAYDVMEQVASSANLNRAYKRVKANKGAPGVDGMTVADLRGWIADNREGLIVSLLDGSYRPQPVRGVEIPKPEWQRGSPAWHPDGSRPAGAAGDPASAGADVRSDIFGLELWVPSWAERA